MVLLKGLSVSSGCKRAPRGRSVERARGHWIIEGIIEWSIEGIVKGILKGNYYGVFIKGYS